MIAADHQHAEPNDPTRSVPPVPARRAARLSQNEIEQLCLKAARGAGMSWGLAEEAGFAAAWLAMRGLDGPSALLAQLQKANGRAWGDICPVLGPGSFRARDGGHLCPIALGAVLCDHARLPDTAMDHSPLRIGPVDNPVLLLGFLSDLARTRGVTVRLDWPGGTVLLSADGLMSGDAAVLAAEARLEEDLSILTGAADIAAVPAQPLYVPAETLNDLNGFAMRTTVPASQASRAGAGSAAGDND